MKTDAIPFLSGKLVELRPVMPEDLATIYGWYNSGGLQKNTSHHRYPNTLAKQQELYASQLEDPTSLSLAVTQGGQLLGTITLLHISNFDQKAELSVHIFEGGKKRTRAALEAALLLIHHGFYALNLNKIYAGMLEGLSGWASLLIDFFDFKREGIRRQDVFKDGRFQDVLQISLLRSEYEVLLKKTKNQPLNYSIDVKDR